MAVLLVAYDLKRPGQNYPGLLDTIKSFPWARLSESSYAIETQLSPTQVRDRVRAFLDQNDHIYVITLTRPWNSWGLNDVNEWLRQRMGSAG
jgi:hypothetical protein